MKWTATVLSALALSGALVLANPPEKEGDNPNPVGPRPPRPGLGMRVGQDPMMQNLFPPPLIHEAADEIGLTDEQEKNIKAEMDKSQDRFADLQKKLRAEMDALVEILKAPRVEESQATAQLAKVLAAESEIKKAHLATLIRVKNLLTAEQQEKLRQYMKERRPQQPGFGPGGGQGPGFGPRGKQGPGPFAPQGPQPPRPPQE